MDDFNKICITKTASTILKLLSVDDESNIAKPIDEILNKAESIFKSGKCDRVFMYNPDAIAMWIYEKYKDMFSPIDDIIDLKLKMLSVFPSVTPVCFASMYSGLEPEAHGILKYEKPVLKVKTIFDILPDNGKKVAIVSTANDSISEIFLQRNVDYFIYKTKEECNKKALDLIKEDKHDLIVLYNGDYDYNMHRNTPEGKRALRALGENIQTYKDIHSAIQNNWKNHNTALAFAPDHGCHKMMMFLGNHGKNEPYDMNIMHFYSFIAGKNA